MQALLTQYIINVAYIENTFCASSPRLFNSYRNGQCVLMVFGVLHSDVFSKEIKLKLERIGSQGNLYIVRIGDCGGS